jgi:signal transduction histidine kinase
MGALLRSLDWSRTPLGPVESWPAALRTSVSTMLGSPYPIALYWGPEYVLMYNDTFRPIFGGKHPASAGMPARQALAEVWDLLEPMLEGVRTSLIASYEQDLCIFMERQGFVEECFFTWSYVPTRDETGRFVGIVTIASETTRQVLSDRRFKTIRELSIRTALDKNLDGVLRSVERVLAQAGGDVPFALLYEVEADKARLAASTGVERGGPAAPAELRLAEDAPWPLAEVLRSGHGVLVEDLGSRFGPLPGGPWPEPATRALLLPVSLGAGGETNAVLVAGLSPRLPLDDGYRDFLQLLSRQVAADAARARAYEEEKRRAEQLAELDRAKTAFFSNVSHEFRTPLTLMLGPLEDALAEEADALPSRQRERLSLVHRSGVRLFKLVNSLLDFSRLEAGRAKVTYAPTDLAALTAELVSHFESAARRADLLLTVDLPALPEPVWLDREAWEKVVFNLLSNALKYTFEGGITVSLRAEGGEAVLRVRDTGTGIPEQALPHVFERFHRVEGARARSHEGSGIGLALVQEFVKLHGGSVSARSIVGEGSTFSVHLPFGTAHLPRERMHVGDEAGAAGARAAPYVSEALGWMHTQAAPTAPPPQSGPRARVLVVDDNTDMRAYIAGILHPSFEVETVEDGIRALESLRANPPDLILSDVMMPRLGGFGLLREVRAADALKTVPFILLSARAGEEASVEGLEAGADDYLVKPFSARELLARVRSHLELAHMRREAVAHAARESSLREAVHARDDFLSVASHELKTPLAALRLQIEALERTLPAEVRTLAGERLFTVRRQSQRLAGLVETMLDVSMVASGRLRLKLEAMDLAVLVADSVAQMREELARQGCALSLESEASLPGRLDGTRLGQLLHNLLSNAARYGAGKPVQVRLRREGLHARLDVVDHGMGVNPEHRERIFNRFERAVSTRHYGGLGLGLWVSRQVVEAHGGAITVTDTPGGGATFTVELPLQ